MKLYEINAEMERLFWECVDPETGEIVGDLSALDALKLERDQKIENTACLIKNIRAERESLEKEYKAFYKRFKAAENRETRLSEYLKNCLQGENFKSTKASISHRKTKAVNITDLAAVPLKYCKTELPKPVKSEIKAAIEAGETVEGAELVENISMIIK